MQQGYNFDPTSLNDKDLQDYLNYFQNASAKDLATPGASPSQLGYAATNRDTLQRLQQEHQARQGKAQTAQNQGLIEQAFGGIGGGTPVNTEQSAQNQRQDINNIYDQQKAGLLQGIDEQSVPARRQAIDEAGALGNLRSPAFQSSTLANMDAQKSRNTSLGLSQLGAQRGQALSGLEGDMQNRALQGYQAQTGRGSALGGLLQEGSQFQQGLGLQQNQFSANQNNDQLNNMFGISGITDAERLGNMQANAMKPTGIQEFGQIAGGVGNLLGGVGGLATGLRGLGAVSNAANAYSNFGGGQNYNYGSGNARQNSGYSSGIDMYGRRT